MNAILSNPVSSMRTLIPFTGGNWSDVLDNEVFQAIIKSPPSFWGLDYRGFQITDMTQVDTDDSGNTARSGGTKLKKNDVEKGWDVSERPLIVVWVGQELYLWDGFNRWWKLNDMGEVYAPTWVYQLKEGFDMRDVKEHVQLSANNSARADEHTKRDFINTGLRWAERHGIEDLKFHDTRHEALSRMFEVKSLNLPEVQLFSGHLEPRTLMRVYANLRPKDLADKLAKME